MTRAVDPVRSMETLAGARLQVGIEQHGFNFIDPTNRQGFAETGYDAVPSQVWDDSSPKTPAGFSKKLAGVVRDEAGRRSPGRSSSPFCGVVKDRNGKPVPCATARVEYVEYARSEGPRALLAVIEPIVRDTPLERLTRTTTDSQGRFLLPTLAALTV